MKKESKIKKNFFIFLLLSVALNLFILINSFIPGDESAVASFWVADMFSWIINFFKAGTINSGNIEPFTYVIRKLIGHFGLFLVDGVFVSLTFYLYVKSEKRMNFWLSSLFVLLIGTLMASTSEMIQIFVSGRIGSIYDVLINVGGYLFAEATIYLIFFLIQSKPMNYL